MKNSFNHLDISISTDKGAIHFKDKFNLKVNIKNNSDIEVENGLFRLIINSNVFNIVDDKFRPCANDFGGVGNIEPGQEIEFEIPIEVKSSGEVVNNICAMLNYHIVENGGPIDLNSKSNDLSINILESNILTNKEFSISSSKDVYFLDEDIDFTIKVKNIGNYKLNNLKISDYIPKNTSVISDSLFSNSLEKLIITEDSIIVTDIDVDEEIEIKYNVSIKNGMCNLEISVLPKLAYTDKDYNTVKVSSNTKNILINTKNMFLEENFKYEINKTEVFEGDIITHTIKLKNITNTLISNLNMACNSNAKLNFVNNSLVINDIYRIDEDVNNLIALGELEPQECMIIEFKTKVKKYDDSVFIKFLIDYNTNRRNLSQVSNTQEYKVLNPIFNSESFTKILDKKIYYIGDICETTIEIINSGNTIAQKAILKDILTQNLEFISGSLYVNGVKNDSDLFYEGIYLDDLQPNKKIIIKYKSKVMDICKSKLTNAFILYCINNNDTFIKAESCAAEINVFGAKIGNNNIKKELSNYSVQTGDIITCKILIENTGNVDCESLKLCDDLNNSLEFIEGSMFINNDQNLDSDILNGVNIDRIRPNEKIVISYQVKILDCPKPNPIIDKSTLVYSFILNDQLQSNTIYSNKSKIYVNNPNLNIADKSAILDNETFCKFCHCQDFLYFSLVLENNGNVGIEDINMMINLPKDLIINQDSLKINGKNYNKSFKNNIKIPNLNVAQKIYIDFFAKHTLLDGYDLESVFYFEYTFKDLKTKIPFRKNIKFKENISIINPDIEINKFISDNDVELDREFTKNINLRNSGNIELKDVKVLLNESKFLNESDSTIFVNGEYMKNTDILNIEKLESNETVNIAIRYNINSIPLCESSIPESEVIAKYYLFDDKPIPIKRKSNKIKLDIKNYQLDIKGKCNSEILMLDETYQYTFNILNNGNIACESLKLDINIPDCFEYVGESLYLNSSNLNLNKLNHPISLGALSCNESINVSFSFISKSIPFKGKSSINAILYGKYDILEKNIKKSFKSNETVLNIESMSIDIVKSASHNYLQTGDKLQIQTILNNTGTINIKDLFIKDNEDENLNFIENSVYIDGENVEDIDPLSGLKLPNLNASENILLTYEYEYLPRICSNKVMHYSNISYSYTKNDNSSNNVKMESEKIYIEGALSTFKQFNIENEYILKDYEPDIYDVVNTFTDAKVENFYEIDSIKNKSYDNSNSTGKKVIVKGFVMNRVEYLIKNEHSSLYMLERSQPFTAFINLPSEYESENLYFKAKCDDVFYKTTSKRGLFVSSLISIEGLL